MSEAGLDWKTIDADSDNPLRVVEFKPYTPDRYRVDAPHPYYREFMGPQFDSQTYFKTLIGAVAHAETLVSYGKECRVVDLTEGEA